MRLPSRVADRLDRFSCGVITLRVPVREGVIQVGTALRLPTATLEVHIRPAAVVVRRTDGAPLQAHVVTLRPDGADVGAAVFADPVDSLTLERDRRSGRWTVVAAGASRPAGLLQFVETVVAFTAAKQEAAARTARSA